MENGGEDKGTKGVIDKVKLDKLHQTFPSLDPLLDKNTSPKFHKSSPFLSNFIYMSSNLI